MENHLNSSEAFAKALKGFQIPPTEKIHLAQEAWRRVDIVLPHKQEFLLEWLCSSLLKSATPGKGSKDASSNVLLDLEYWELFRDMLTGIAHNKKKSRHMGSSSLGLRHHSLESGITESQAPGVLLRVPIVPIFAAVVQKLLLHTSTSTAQPISDSIISGTPKQKRKSKAHQAPAEAVQESASPLPSMAVIEAVKTSLELLCGSFMSEWFQPTLEQYTPLVQATLEAMVDLDRIKTLDSGAETILLDLGFVVLDRFRRLVVVQPNQKKVFTLLAGPMFEALIGARFSIRDVQGHSGKVCQEVIGHILRSGLFHQEHLQEYTSGYHATGGAKSLQSYQKQLFDHTEEMKNSSSVLDVLPVFLSYFVDETRRKQRALASSGFDRGIESAREIEFEFFKIVYVLAQKQLPSLDQDASENAVGQLADIMEALNNLLSTLLDLNMYQPSNNEEADQYVFMSTSFQSLYSCLMSSRRLTNGRLQSISLHGIVVLSQLDDRLLKPHLDSLWPTLLCPLEQAQDAALELGKTLLEIYGKSSDLATFLTSFLAALREFVTRPEDLRMSPMFSRQFLDLIPSNIRSHLPLPQSPVILDIFVGELMALDSSLDRLEGLDLMTINGQEGEEETDKKKKKRKLNSGKSKSTTAADLSLPSAELVTVLFIQFLKGLRVTANQEKQLNKEFEALYHHFLKQIFDRVASSSSKITDGQVSETFQSRRLTPALQLHFALCKVSTKYWTQGMSMDLIKKIVKRLAKSSTDWTDTVVLTMNRVVLQHVHLTLCSSQTTVMEETQMQQCQELVQFTMKSSRLESLVDKSGSTSELSVASWDGRLEHARGDQFLVASWQIQVNDWLDIVCRFGKVQDMNLIATVIAGHFSQQDEDCNNREGQDKISTQITIHLLNQILLRSANFYEVPNFRQIFAQKILQELSSSITLLSVTDAEKALATTVSTFTSAGYTTTTTTKAAYQDALKELVEVSKKQGQSGVGKRGASKSSKSSKASVVGSQGSHLLSLLSIMHLLPLEYFEKFERNIILTTMAVLDYYIPRYLSVESSEVGLKCLLLERRISNAIMTWRMDAGVLCFDSQILLNLLVPYPAWTCASTVGHEDKGGFGQATLQTSSLMLDHAVRYLMTQFQQQPHLAAQLDMLLTSVLQSWAQSSDVIESSSWTAGIKGSNTKGRLQLSESRIKFVLLSQACQSLVQGLEGLHQHRSKSRSKKAKADSNSMDVDQESNKNATSLEVKINQLFDTVQAKTISRIGQSLALLKPLKRDMLVKNALECMDHIELYKTLVQYRRLKSDEQIEVVVKKASSKTNKQEQCLDLVERLFQLAQALVHEIHESQHHSHHDKEEGLEHLAAVLTAYSCEYLPKSSAWPQQGQESESTANPLEKQLLELLVRISGQQHWQKADVEDVVMLKDAYLILLGQLTETQFESLLQWLLEEKVVIGEGRSSAATAVDELILVRYLDVTFLSAHHKQKRLVRRQISKLLTRSIQILQSTTSVEVVIAILDLMAGICSETSFELRSWEVGLVLEGITSLMSPATPLLHLVFGDLSRGETPMQLRNQDTTRIFTSLYHVLMNVTRFRQEELTSLIPVFMAILQGCLHGFKSLHGSIAKRQQGLESLVKSPFMLLSAGVLTPVSTIATGTPFSKTAVVSAEKATIVGEKHASVDKLTAASTTTPVTVVMGDPLPVECAENFSRLLTALGSKGVVSHHQQHQQQQQQQQQQDNALNGMSTSTTSGFTTVSADASKAFGKHAPYLLMEYFTIQCSVVASIRSLELRNALLPGLYGLLNLCSEWEREMMMVGLDNTGKTLLKGLYADYLKYHKYTGQ